MSSRLRILDAATIRALAPPDRVVGWMRETMKLVGSRQVELPLRQAMRAPDDRGALGIMPGYVGGDIHAAGIKLVSLVPPHRRKGSSHLGLMTLYDGDGLVPRALLCGATITAMRTAAATAMATDVLARENSSSLLIIGNGEQADAHIAALKTVRAFTDVRIWARNPASPKAIALAAKHEAHLYADIEEALDGADVICTVTSAREPLLFGNSLSPGVHVNLVGSSTPDAREADDAVVERSRYVVDYIPSALAQSGELLHAIDAGVVTPDHIAAEIGSVIMGNAPGRQSSQDITVYKSLGIAAQDIVTAHKIVELAEEQGLGVMVQV